MIKSKINYLLFFIIILSFSPIFFGFNFFAEEDVLTIFNHTNGNVIGNGWRPERGLGTSYFFGDPGAFHAWSILTILNKIFNLNNFNFYNLSIIILIFLGTISTANFLKNIHSDNVSILIILLSLLIFLNPMRYELIFQRHWIASTFSLPILIYYTKIYLEEKNKICYFFVTLSLSFSIYLGSIATLQNILLTGFIFLIVHCFYRKDFITNFKRFINLYFTSLIITFLIGLWVWYPIFIEYFSVGYERSYTEYFDSKDFIFNFNFYNIGKFVFSLFNSGIFSSNISLPDKGLLPLNSWFNVNPLFPLIFIFYLFNSPKNYWEYVSRNIVIIYFFHYFLISFLGGYKNIPIYFFKLYSWHKFFLDLYFFQIILISFFVLRMKEFFNNKQIFFLINKSFFGFMILSLYIFLSIFSFFSLTNNFEIINFLTDNFFNLLDNFNILKKSLIVDYSDILKEILYILSEKVNYLLFLFYLSTIILLILLFSKKSFIRFKNLFIVFLILNSFLLSYGVYPLVEKNLIWSKKTVRENIGSLKRSAYIDLSIDEIYKNESLERKLDVWKNNSSDFKQIGYLNPPGLSFSSILSHWNKDASKFLSYHLNKTGFQDLREISDGNNLLLMNKELINFLNIKYLYFRNKPNENFIDKKYILLHEQPGLYLYENPNSLPYYYFGNEIKINLNSNIKNLNKGGFVIQDKKIFNNLKNMKFDDEDNKEINLVEWKNGSLIFDYKAQKDNVLIIHDLWHPNWKVKKIQTVEGSNDKLNKEISIFKANYIFKGLLLPKGNYRFELFYDTKKYYLGIYMSIISIIIFIIIFFKIKRNEQS